MKKRGYTLIELIAVIAILLILFSGGFAIINMLNNIKGKVELEDAVYRVHALISYSKSYCRKNSQGGNIIIDEVEGMIEFQPTNGGNKSVKNEEMPRGSKISVGEVVGNLDRVIPVNDKGYLSRSTTITIKHEGEVRKITTTIGTGSVNIKDVIR